ncbi:phosphoglucomutase [Caryophanon latum]|uniref:Phosphoglucomutase n=2 Tax=Caryophanon latum TaxID=33977 RepID=A0A1C0YIQ5_9BACL|nr:phospho-sugar mutase [Caryophanon latum]OCS87055.1 phosphoglucomutase [Caryophanon latum]
MNETVQHWLKQQLPTYMAEELAELQTNSIQLEDAFYRLLPFGTGGMRGELGVGTNRMNIYTVRLAAHGLAQHVVKNGEQARGVVIAYDTRHFSKEFAVEAARVLGAYGVKSYVFSEARPTPQLSFAVRHYNAFAGVVITASHNPKQYNGFKVYGSDGAQMVPTDVKVIIDEMKAVENLFTVPVADFEAYSEWILDDIDEAYLARLMELKEREVDASMKLVYTPLHGAGLVPVERGLRAFGFDNVTIVAAQAIADGDFPTVPYPNPEEAAAFTLAIAEGKKVGADLLLATDPDADRLGVAVRDGEDYVLLTGNQLGALVVNYLIEAKKEAGTLPENAVVLKTIVTSELGASIARANSVEVVDVLTGFKYIAEKIEQYTTTGEKQFLFGYEESYGYLVKDFVRDKDAVQLALLTAEMASYYAAQEKTLLHALRDLFETYGYYKEALISKAFVGKSGQEEMQQLLTNYRNNPLTEIAGVAVTCVEDYLTKTATFADGTTKDITLPSENVLKYVLEDGSWVAIRPSGTEPKCKFYVGVNDNSSENVCRKLNMIQTVFL